MKKILVIALFALVGCGSDDSEEPSGYSSEYPQADQNAFLTECISESMRQSTVMTKPRASMYCSCILEKIMDNYPYAELNAHPATVIDAVAQQHAKGCVDMAMKY